VRFLDIDQEERHAIFVLLVQFLEGANLGPEWTSGVAAEDKHYGALSPEVG
jgi:hypothetical protein